MELFSPFVVETGGLAFRFIPEIQYHKFRDEAYEERRGHTLAVYEGGSMYCTERGQKKLVKEIDESIKNNITKITLTPTKGDEFVYGYSYAKPDGSGVLQQKSVLFYSGSELTIDNSRDLSVGLFEPRYFLFDRYNKSTVVIAYIRTTDSMVCYRTDRDSFKEEFELITVPESTRILKIGLGDNFKFQITLALSSKHRIENNTLVQDK